MSDNDDAQVGRVLTRREVLALFGAAGAAVSLAACLPGASSAPSASSAASAGKGLDFTSQLYFDDAVSDAVFTRGPYAAESGRRVRNAEDGIYGQGGDQLTLSVDGDPDTGYTARFEIGLQVA